MTDEEIDNLCGRKLDAAIAEYIFGRPRGSRSVDEWISHAIGSAQTERKPWPIEGCDFPLTVDGVNYDCIIDRNGPFGSEGWIWLQREGKPWQDAVEKLVARWIDPQTPRYSTDIAAAWDVVEAMKKNGVEIMLWSDAAGITCRFHTYERMEESCSASAPLSICRAALKFVLAEKEPPCQTLPKPS